MKTTLMALCTLSLLITGDLMANPISTESLRIRQVPDSTHVQVTWAVMENEGAVKPTVNEISRDGAVLTDSWHELAAFTANTGSGLTSEPATQYCDCDVSVGSHEYVVKAVGYFEGKEVTRTVTFMVMENQGSPKPQDAGVPAGDMSPWDIPEPTEIQGLDCLTECKVVADAGGVSKDAAGPTPKDAGPATQKDANTEEPEVKKAEDDGGCSISGAQGGTGSILLLLALGLMIFRRRRG